MGYAAGTVSAELIARVKSFHQEPGMIDRRLACRW
jgi:hypothetical protein